MGKFLNTLVEYDKHVRRLAFWEGAVVFWGKELATHIDDIGNAMYSQAVRSRDKERELATKQRIILSQGVYRA